jgi:hypothetical protein
MELIPSGTPDHHRDGGSIMANPNIDKNDDFLWFFACSLGGGVIMSGLCLAMTLPILLLIALGDWLGIGGWAVAAMVPLMLVLCHFSPEQYKLGPHD